MKQPLVRFGGAILLATAIAACSGTNAVPVANGTDAAPQVQQFLRAPATKAVAGVLEITQADREMARSFVPGRPHIMVPTFTHHAKPASAVGYPLDMTCQTPQCPVMNASVAYNVYVTPDGKTCKDEKCWGDPEEFLKAISGSPLVGLVQQYTKGAPTAYTYGSSIAVKYKLAYTNTFYNNDLWTILSAAAHHFKAVGTNAEYHIFLPPGVDTCFDQTSECYSPDNLTSFAFCAYHTAVLFGKTPIVYSVEPWQDVQVTVSGKKVYGCQDAKVPPGTNRLNSGTASTLLHESMESWSDPLPNTGWFNSIYGEEIGDTCAYLFMTKEVVGGGSWFVQQIWSNTYHGCADTP
ncbi:MAG: hypothetical protein JO192_10130 [Candidatus Eremiobacteraeota bacterium]|nr:hypothetical protein [Candidatus Eremiobacteraeota bacterium]MBV8720750.1 hypothetical protein [Candidatus Eremiobacteraeota bacterium]